MILNSCNITTKVREFINRNIITFKANNIIVGFSGGADSVSLLFILNELRKEVDEYASLNLHAVHVNHGIRKGEADRDEAFARDFCKKLSIPFISRKIDVPTLAANKKEGLEKIARDERYRIFREEGERLGTYLIATAHHKNDLAETLIFNISRGTGFKGLIGIKPINGKIIRPLLDVKRSEIDEFVKLKGLSFVTDSTNEDRTYTRNLIRKEIIPFMEDRVNKRLVDHLARLSKIAMKLEDHVESLTYKLMEDLNISREEIFKRGETFIIREAIEDLDEFVLDNLFMELIKSLKGHGDNISGERIEALTNLFRHTRGSIEMKFLELGEDIIAQVNSHGLRLSRKEVLESAEYERSGEIKEKYLILDEIGRDKLERGGSLEIVYEDVHLSLNLVENFAKTPNSDYTKYFDYDKIKTNIFLRKRAASDWIQISEVSRKKLKKELIDRKVPKEKRNNIWLLTDEESQVFWAIGLRQSYSSLVRCDNKEDRILKISFKKRNGDSNE